MATPIVINYKTKPRGQVGERPRKLAPGTQFFFTSPDGDDLSVDFKGNSPLTSGENTAHQGVVVTAANKPGRYPFECFMTVDGERRRLSDSADDESRVEGELEVGPG